MAQPGRRVAMNRRLWHLIKPHSTLLAAAIVLLLLLFGGGGLISSSLQILWIILLIGLILWALGFVFRGTSGGRWYRW